MKLIISLLILITSGAFADAPSKSFLYQGQESESVELNWEKTGTLYRTEYRDSTCTREVPYEVYECNMETRYRSECSTIPGRNDCRTVYDNVCRSVPRQRQECSNGPSRRECTTSPPRTRCTTIPARERCRDVRGERRCTTIPSRERCNTVPGRERCTDVPGQRTCRMVTYNDTECDTVSREQCDWIPSEEVCEDIPYEEEVCGDRTYYRTEEYACQEPYQVPYETVVAKYKTTTEVKFSGASEQDIEFKVSLNNDGKAVLKLVDDLANTDLIFLKDKTETSTTNGLDTTTNQTFALELKSRQTAIDEAKNGIESVSMSKETQSLSFTLGKNVDSKNYELKLRVVRRGELILSRILALSDSKLKLTEVGTKLVVFADLEKLGAYKKIRKRKYEVEITLTPKKIGEVLNTVNLPELKTEAKMTVRAGR